MNSNHPITDKQKKKVEASVKLTVEKYGDTLKRLANDDHPNTKQTVDEILIIGFLYGIESDRLSIEEVDHRVAGFTHSKGYAEAKAQLAALIDQIIGEDEAYTIVGTKYNTDSGKMSEIIGDGEQEWKDPRNELRAEIRERAKELL